MQLEATATICSILVQCSKRMWSSPTIWLYRLIVWVTDSELQEDLLGETSITLEQAEKEAITRESVKLSRKAMIGDSALAANYLQSCGEKARDQKECTVWHTPLLQVSLQEQGGASA